MNARRLAALPCKVMPDINDPNLYCCCYDKMFSVKRTHKRHLLCVHAIRPSASKKQHDLLPEENNTDNYCCIGQKTYDCGNIYCNPLADQHEMSLKPSNSRTRSTLLPDPFDFPFLCKVCDITEKSLYLYQSHCKYVYGMKLGHFKITNPDAVVDANSPTTS